jgi:hypothetical protein
MKTNVWYSVRNGGDGSAYPQFMESRELCEIDQRFMDEGWGEDCSGCVVIESDSPIKVLRVETAESIIAELEGELKEDYYSDDERKDMEDKLSAIKAL